ncbi:sushi, von Willebrand factor type A, EGF and pentraxin domain-containing protein 1-like [Venturia canescens]|uniref:sushi, von Willebrand factor type A, EGF and pentraxin domain-containing protein 1-like n=1 Tax=Venturia canescens TaxID=32260 RepID=UPI001C9C7D94|nr:sushi, von Willebrand factor type A, EGF and pentraxin domain-containing protein 1-like [Venturia canescens]
MFVKILHSLILLLAVATLSTSRAQNSGNISEITKLLIEHFDTDFVLESSDNATEFERLRRMQYLENPERILQSKVNVLARLLKIHVDHIRDKTDQVELVFLVDASASVGLANFRSELNFVRKLLSDFTVEPNATRVAVVTFAGKRHILRHIDQISKTDNDQQKCQLLNKQLSNVSYTGGGTYTRGALLEALAILQSSREGSEKVVFLITDGFSNSGDPRPAAKHLKNIGATIFTFGIRTGNVEELHDIASQPGYTHSYLLDSFPEFEALARRALHRDLKAGRYVPVSRSSDCNRLCSPKNSSEELADCCDELATCACGTATGHYACLCPRGYFGSGLKGFCQPCPNGTFDPGDRPIDSNSQCTPCSNVNHVTFKTPATSPEDCVCAPGFITDGENCEAIRCPKLKVPENGYFVKASACSNVVNAACGLRCRIGFNLIGDSIRLCRNDGVWSGVEPQCLLKTCAALRAPMHGRIRCQHEENEKKVKAANLTAYPIDTRCQFRCDSGFQLRGSKVRNCLPLSRWDGLKVTCKQIKCEPLRKLANGNVTPEICTGPKKLAFQSNCTFSCQQGFLLVGPKTRHCSGKNGIWSQRHTTNQCIDNTSPTITCPKNSTWQTVRGKDYALVNWTVPVAADNSDKAPNVWSKPHVKLPWRARIGLHKIVYVAQDSSGNKAKCKFFVRVVDEEPPTIENCVDPPVFLTVRQSGEEKVTWSEPIFHDNSGGSVKVKKSHSKAECDCPLGRTQIFYDATDPFDNSAKCVINVTVEDTCQNFPVVPNGQANCEDFEGGAVKCVITCEDGYAVAFDHESDLILTCGLEGKGWNNTYFPECSLMEIPNSIGRDVDVILQGNSTVCDNSTVIHELTDQIAGNLNSNILDACGNEIDCTLIKYDSKCEEEITEDNEVASNALGRRKRTLSGVDAGKTGSKGSRVPRLSSKTTSKPKNKPRGKKKKSKIEMKFRFIGKILAENRNNPKVGIEKLREKIGAMTKSGKLNSLSNKTHQEIAKLALNFNTIFKEAREICQVGRVFKKHNCTKCPMGTFHNTTRDQCQACYFGEYQNSTAATKCLKCPAHTFTRKMHTKKLSDCLPVCKPGHFSRRKVHQVSSAGLEPCTTCNLGSYQPDYGKTFCHVCPDDKTTNDRGSTSLEDCITAPKILDPCLTMPCKNGGNCTSENDNFSCDCPENYLGSTCERRQNACESSPCLNEGDCSFLDTNATEFSYSCNCKAGFTGRNCQIYIDECSLSPCQNGGSCISTEKDFHCACKNGFEGDFCEIVMNHCEPWTCEEGSTCITVDATWQCLCKPGFLGLRCNLLPCDWIPCHPNAICLNVYEINATRNSYRCVCPDGYEGEDCAARTNHCKVPPCLNGGKCVNGLLNYTCECPLTYSGSNCETELTPDFVLNFSEVGTNDYVIMKGPKKNVTELTVCLWLQSVDTFNYGTVLSYATKYQDNALTVTDYNGFVLYVNGEEVVTDITLNDGYWHFLCVDWRSEDGAWHAYVDGVLRDNGTLLAKGTEIGANGSIVIGQEQDRLGGGFSASEAFLGKLSYLDIWDETLSHEDVTRLSRTCESYHGSIVAWAQTRRHIRGGIQILDAVFCRGCPTPAPPTSGYISLSEDGSEAGYWCETGHSVRVGNWFGSNYSRKCLKHGQWEGHREPICTKIKCGHPGYFPRGRITGKSFMYGDEINYNCQEGYELRGNPHRVCNANGHWSGNQPICIGVTCKNLLAPENGDIEYIIEEHERDDVSILQVGQQLEFKCDEAFRLSGERYLTCLETGKWDHVRPRCVPSGCLPPKIIQHGYISTKQSTILPAYKKSNETLGPSKSGAATGQNISSVFSFGDVLGFSCHEGYKFRGNRNLLVEFRLQCSGDGTWAGHVPDCVRLRCATPKKLQNGRIFFLEGEREIEIFAEGKSEETKALPTLRNGTKEIEESADGETEIELFDELAGENDAENENSKREETIAFTPGTKIFVSCNRGYGSGLNFSRVCLENENWSSEERGCPKRECPSHDHPVIGLSFANQSANETATNYSKIIEGTLGNLYFSLKGVQFEDEFALFCPNDTKIDLEIIGGEKEYENLTWVCGDQGKWQIRHENVDESKLAKLFIEKVDICQRITCSPLKIPSNAYIVDGDDTETTIRKVNDTLKLRCETGYDLGGPETVSCLPGGNWSALPTCNRVLCKNPPKISNARLNETSAEMSEYVFGVTVTYECARGYRVYGQANAKCLANGKWSRILGKCSKISCGKPKIPPGVTVYGRSYLYQEVLSYKCPGGVTKGSITCQSDGKWSDPPDCKPK